MMLRNIALAVALGAALLILLVIAAIVALPPALGAIAQREITRVTGRVTTIGDVDLNLFTRHLVVRNVRVADRPGEPPLAEVGRLDARFGLFALLHGKIEIDALSIDTPVVRVRRDVGGRLNVADIFERYLTRPGGEARPFLLRSFTIDRGHLVFDDRAVTPARVWETTTLAVAVKDVGSELKNGRATVRFELGGAKTVLEAEHIAAHPVAATFRLSLQDFDLGVFRPYLPPNAGITFTGGRLSTRIDGRYGVVEGLKASATTAVRDVALVRLGDAAPFLTAPTLDVVARDVTWLKGVTGVARLEVSGAPRVIDRRVDPPRRIDVTPFHAVVEAVRFPSRTPARLTVTAGLEGASLEAKGTAALQPLFADLTVALAGANLALARPYLPAHAEVTPDGGVLAATLTVRADKDTVSVSGDYSVTDLVVGRAGQSEPLVRDALMKGSVTNLTVRGGALAADALTLTGAPTIVEASRGIARQFELKALTATVRDGTWPGRRLATVELDAVLATGGTASVRGTAHPGTLEARSRVDVKDVHVMPFASYVPADVPVRLSGGRLTGRLHVTHDRRTGLTLNGRARVADLALVQRTQPGVSMNDSRFAVRLRDLVVKDGALAIREATVTGTPRITDTTGRFPQQFDASRFTGHVRDLTWPARGAAQVSLDVAFARGGSSTLTGTVNPATLEAEARASFSGFDIARFTTYLPANAPVALGGGLLTGQAHLTHDKAAGVHVNGTATINDLVLLRRGYANAFVTDPSLDLTVADLVVKDGALTIGRAELAGTPIVTDASARIPQTFEMSTLSLVAEHISWPSTGPLRVTAKSTLVEGGRSTLDATIDAASLAARGRVTLTDVPLRYANGYLAPDLAVLPSGGRLEAAFDIVHDRSTGVVIDGDGAITELALVRRGEREPILTDPRLRFSVADLRIRDDAYSAARLAASGAPVLLDQSSMPVRRLALPGFTLAVEQARWPSDRPGTLSFDAQLPDAGALTARGSVDLGTRTVDAQVELRDAAVAPFVPFLPISTTARGIFDGSLTFRGIFAGELRATSRGALRARDVALGPGPDVSIAAFDVRGIDFTWPDTVRIEAITVRQPYLLLERATDGSFPLRAKLRPRPRVRANATPVPAAVTPVRRTAPTKATDWLHFTIGTIAIEEGEVRFLDRTTRPFYSEEITQFNVTIRELTNLDERQATVSVQGVVGGNAALTLTGVAAPFADTVVADLEGELRDFPVVRTNPYLEKVVDWIARSGRLTTRVHYVVQGDQLRATNDIVVQRLDVAPGDGGADRVVGVPLGLAVSLLKDTRGDIRLSLPVEGRLSSPQFDYGDAVGIALRNTVARMVTAPFRAIGGVVQREHGEPEVQVQPLVFPAGSAALAPESMKQLQRVADVLRAAPQIRIGLGVVVTAGDVTALRAGRTVARIQRLQRDKTAGGFDTAARQLWTDVFPGRPAPATTDEIVRAISAASPATERATQRLVTRRLAAVRQALIEATGIAPERVVPIDNAPASAAAGPGRVEFKLLGR
jgi:hypothetical protein